MTVFIDTSAVFALADVEETRNEDAVAVWGSLVGASAALVTTSYVVLEICALLQRRLGLRAVRVFDAKIYPQLHVEWSDAECHESAMRILLATGRQKLSLVDCVSFVVMRRLGISKVFCFDDHFREQGFDVIPAAPIS